MTNDILSERCDLSVACLPESPYRAQLRALLDELLALRAPAAAPQALRDDDRIFTLWKIANAELGGDDSHDWTDFAAGARAILAAPVTPPALLREAMEALENSENEMRRDLWPDHPSRKQNAAAITKLRAALKETP